jgi:hypothetical protein
VVGRQPVGAEQHDQHQAALSIAGDLSTSNFGGNTINISASGSLTKTSGSGISQIEFAIDDDGVINANSGTLRLTGGDAGTPTGTMAIATGATLELNSTWSPPSLTGTGTAILLLSGGTLTTANTATFSVPTVNQTAGTWTLNKNISQAAYSGTGGTRAGSGTLTITGSSVLNGITLNSAGTTTIANTVTTDTFANVTVFGTHTLNINHDTSWTSGSLSAQNSTININAALSIAGDLSTSNFGGNTINISASGSLTKTSGSGISQIEFATISDGLVTVTSGTLRMNDLTVNGGTVSVPSGRTLDGTMTVAGGTLQGFGTVGNVSNTGGTVAPGSSPGVLSVSGNYTQGSVGTLKTDITGTTVGTEYDQLAVAGNTTLDGTLAIVNGLGFDPQIGQGFIVVTTAGTQTGQFAALTGANVNGKVYAAQYNANNVTIGVGLAKPSNTGLPSIPGSATTGDTISCDPGTWTGTPTFGYQWRSDGAPIGGATNQQYMIADADAGHTLTCHLTATNGSGSDTADSNGMVPTLAAPSNSSPPSIPASGAVGDQERCNPGTWLHNPTFAFVWLRDGTPIGGATAQLYTLTADDAGHSITCRVTATNAGGSNQATSNALAAAAPGPTSPSNTTAPSITGAAVIDGVLTCAPGAWTGSPTFTFQWLRDGTPIAGATQAKYTLTIDDTGHAITCRVSATNAGGSTSATSAATNVTRLEQQLVTASPDVVATVLGLPVAKKCLSRRNFLIHVARLSALKIKRVVITVNGKRVKVSKVAGRFTARVDLRGLPKGKFTVKISVSTAAGNTLRGKRSYRTCLPKRLTGHHPHL